jgi:hypothetical protein
MALRNLPVVLDGYTLMITEAPEVKMRTDDDGNVLGPKLVYGTDQPEYVVSLFAKRTADANGRKGKGEEIKVTLTSDPGEDWTEGQYVALRRCTVSLTAIPHPTVRNAFSFAGLSFQAEGLSPAVRNGGQAAA